MTGTQRLLPCSNAPVARAGSPKAGAGKSATGGGAAGGRGILTAQALRAMPTPIIKPLFAPWKNFVMTLLLLEALGALLILVFIVWWTMFSGREGGEIKRGEEPEAAQTAEAAARRSPEARQDPEQRDKG